MRLIIMRHGESQNNVLSKISHELSRQYRTAEPEISNVAIGECRAVGTKLTEMGLNFDLMLCGAQKRAVQSLKYVRETLVSAATTPCEILK